MWPSPGQGQVRTHKRIFSELNGWPELPPVNASPAPSRGPAHDLGPNWFATPCLCGSCIRYSFPALTGAIQSRNKYAEGVTQPSPALLAQRATLGQMDLFTDLPWKGCAGKVPAGSNRLSPKRIARHIRGRTLPTIGGIRLEMRRADGAVPDFVYISE